MPKDARTVLDPPDNPDHDVPGLDEKPVLEGLESSDEVETGHPDASDDTRDDTTAALSDEPDTDWKKRHGDAVRWAQQERQRREQIEQEKQRLEARINKLRQAGLEIDEIFPDEPAPMAAPSGDYVPKDEFQKTVQSVQQVLWNTSKAVFAASNPEFKNPDMNRLLDLESTAIVQEEMASTGGQISLTPDQILERAAKRVRNFVNKLKSEGEKSAMQKRKKISSSGIPEGHDKGKPGAEEEEAPFDPRASYVKLREKRFGRIRKPST